MTPLTLIYLQPLLLGLTLHCRAPAAVDTTHIFIQFTLFNTVGSAVLLAIVSLNEETQSFPEKSFIMQRN